MRQHTESKHEGVRYPCDQCMFAATQQGHLKQHKQAKHGHEELNISTILRYPCDQCEYTTTTVLYLRRHKKAKHCTETALDNVEQKYPTVLKRKVNVRIEKLDYSDYLRTQNKLKSVESVSRKLLQMYDTESVFVDIVPTLQLAETEVKEKDITEDELINPFETQVKKEESDYCDLKSKIEIEEDMILQTESSGLSEFVQEINENSSIEFQTVDDDDDESRRSGEDEFSNRVTMEEFFPHLSGSQDYMYY